MKKTLLLILGVTFLTTGCMDSEKTKSMNYENKDLGTFEVQINEYDDGHSSLYEILFISEWADDIDLTNVTIELNNTAPLEGTTIDLITNEYIKENYLEDLILTMPKFSSKEPFELHTFTGAFYLQDISVLNDLEVIVEYKDTSFTMELSDDEITNTYSVDDMGYGLNDTVTLDGEYDIHFKGYETYTENENFYIILDVIVTPLNSDGSSLVEFYGTVNKNYEVYGADDEFEIEGVEEISAVLITEETQGKIILLALVPEDFEEVDIENLELIFGANNSSDIAVITLK